MSVFELMPIVLLQMVRQEAILEPGERRRRPERNARRRGLTNIVNCPKVDRVVSVSVVELVDSGYGAIASFGFVLKEIEVLNCGQVGKAWDVEINRAE